MEKPLRHFHRNLHCWGQSSYRSAPQRATTHNCKIKEHQLKTGQLVERLIHCEFIRGLSRRRLDHMLYECSDVTLAEIPSTPLGELSNFHIAAIRNEVSLYTPT